jgi:hypothetical protein
MNRSIQNSPTTPSDIHQPKYGPASSMAWGMMWKKEAPSMTPAEALK